MNISERNYTREGPKIEAENTWVFALVFVLHGVIALVGIIGNLLVFKAILTQRKLKVSEYFILNLCATDLGACLISIPLDLIERATKQFLFGSFLCQVIYPLQTIFMSVSVMTLLIMSIERYCLIVTPFRRRLGSRIALGTILLTWVVSVVIVLPYILILTLEDDQCVENWPQESHGKAFTLCVFLVLYVIPLSLITGAYTRIIRCLQQDSRSQLIDCILNDRTDRKQQMVLDRIRRNVQVVQIFVAAGIAFAACMLPTHVCWLWYDYGGVGTVKFTTIVTFANVLMYSNSAIDPFIFGSIKLRRFCVEFMCGRFCGRNTQVRPLLILRTRLMSVGTVDRVSGYSIGSSRMVTERETCL